jgi:transposase
VIALTPQVRVWVAVAPADFRCGIDGLARRVRQVLADDPFGGAVFVFRNRRGTAIKLLAYDLGEAPRYVELEGGAGLYPLIPGPLRFSNST